ncbi:MULTISPECIES: hypothetical protein [Vibrio harveyi group]|uniref:hypothetical protein n=1 Tax=Vibrio harveyi group TaxID=717610 RepID=UPI000CE55FE1|nr:MULTISPECIES: hypothetical protein [Vibrio harveyi group]MCE7729230.1 hypothetical protein [Vibrio campbellii]
MAKLEITGSLRATYEVVNTMREELITNKPEDVQHIERHKGRFDTKEELQRFTKKNNTILVSALQTSNHETRNGHTADISLVAFIVCRAISNDTDAGMICELLSTKVTKLVATQRWGIQDAAQAQGIKSANLYSATLDGLGVSVWAVSWVQNMSMENTSTAELDDFKLFIQSNEIAQGAPTLDAHVELEGAGNGESQTET